MVSFSCLDPDATDSCWFKGHTSFCGIATQPHRVLPQICVLSLKSPLHLLIEPVILFYKAYGEKNEFVGFSSLQILLHGKIISLVSVSVKWDTRDEFHKALKDGSVRNTFCRADKSVSRICICFH